MTGIALTRLSLTMQLTSGAGADDLAHVCGKRRTLRATIVTIFSHVTRDVSVFVKCDTILDFFWKLAQFHISKFRKVVRQHAEGMMGNIIWVLLEIYLAFNQ